MRYFSVDRIYDDFRIILQSGQKVIRLIDSDFILHPDFCKICEKVKKINTGNKLIFILNCYAEHIDKKKADLLKELNINYIEIGLQTINPTTLENIQRRPLNREKFITGLRLLEERKINYSLDFMIGLPSDTLQNIKETVKFLKDNKVNRETIGVAVLFVLPGTRLRREAKRYGIKYQTEPPYLLIEASYISRDEIEEAITTFFQIKPKPSFNGTLISYCSPQYPRLQEKEKLINFFKIKWMNNNISRVIIELDHACQTINQLRIIGKRLNRMIYQPFTIWFKSQNVEKDLPLIKSFILPLVSSNPFLIWRVILETDNILSLEIIEAVKKCVCTKEIISQDTRHSFAAISICAIFPHKSNKNEKQWLRSFTETTPFFWSLNISKKHAWRSEIDDSFQEKYSSGILIDFDSKSNMDFIITVLKFLYKKTKTQYKNILFRNLAMDYPSFIEQKGGIQDIPIIQHRRNDIESILSLDKNMNISSVLTPSNEIVMDIIACQIRLQKVLKTSEANRGSLTL